MSAPKLLTGTLALVALAAVLALGGCNGDDGEDATVTSAAAAAATTAAATTSEGAATSAPTQATTATAAATEAATGAFGLTGEQVDGLVCTGEWRNETFGSSGAFAATFEVGGEGGQVTLDLGGNVFGGTGGTVQVPYRLDGETVIVEADLGFLGTATMSLDGSTNEATFAAPPALGAGSTVALTDFSFDGEQLAAAVSIDFGGGGDLARSVIESNCALP